MTNENLDGVAGEGGTAAEGDTGTDGALLNGDQPEGGESGAEGDAGKGAEGSEGNGEGDKGKEGDQPKAPDEYAEFTFPEGTEIDSELLTAATPMFKELGLTQEHAQKVVDFYAGHVAALTQQQTDAFQAQITGWVDSAKTDKEFGGDKFDENLGIANRALSKFATPELKQLLVQTGYGNHPELLRVFYRIGQAIKEDSPGAGNAGAKPKDRAETLYPSEAAQ